MAVPLPASAADDPAAGLPVEMKWQTQPSYAQSVPSITLDLAINPKARPAYGYGSILLTVDGVGDRGSSVSFNTGETVSVAFRAYGGTREYSAEYRDNFTPSYSVRATTKVTVVAEPVRLSVTAVRVSEDAKTFDVDMALSNVAPTPWPHDLQGDVRVMTSD